MDNKKRTVKEPSTSCQYGENCYRKNPSHFADYAHQHLMLIRESCKDSNNQYTIPNEFNYAKDIIREQLKILDNLFPRLPTPKKPKLTDSSEAVLVATTSSSLQQLAQCLSPSPINDSAASLSQQKAISPSKKSDLQSATMTNASTAPKTQLIKNATVTSAQLKNTLRATLEKICAKEDVAAKEDVTAKEDVAAKIDVAAPGTTPTTSSNSQSDQLNAYRQRHIQNRPTVTTTNQQPSHSRVPVTNPSTSSNVTRNIHDYISVVNPRGEMAAKLVAAAPYNFFLTTITASKPTHNEPLSITFQEILDPSLGDLESSVQMNFMVDIGWVLSHYYFAGYLEKPMLVLYGDETPELKMVSSKKPQVTAIKVHMSSPFGTHHTKMMLLGYKDGSMRVVVSTANLVEDDWHNRTQGLWLSPKCPALAENADTAIGDSPTGFRDDLLRYLITYNIPTLQPWIARIRKTDFSKVNVFFVASVPGGHRETPRGYQWGHARVGYILSQHCAPVDDACPIVAQSSSIGSLGPTVQSWIMADVANSFRKDNLPIGIRRLPMFRMVYPSFANVKGSHDDLLGGGCLPYRKAINDKQPWLKSHLFQWRSRNRHRSQAMPHIKTYCRWSDRGMYWFVLTSANLSKAAWGAFNKGSKLDMPLRIMSYEAGVLFLPKFVLKNNANFFPMNVPKDGVPPFPMPYDLPLIPYGTDDTPFVMDYLLS